MLCYNEKYQTLRFPMNMVDFIKHYTMMTISSGKGNGSFLMVFLSL